MQPPDLHVSEGIASETLRRSPGAPTVPLMVYDQFPSSNGPPPPPGSYSFGPDGSLGGLGCPNCQTCDCSPQVSGLGGLGFAWQPFGGGAVGWASSDGRNWRPVAGRPGVSGLGFAWIPIAITAASTAASMFFGRKAGAQKIAATQVVDEAERLLQDNLDSYLSMSPRSASTQAQAAGNFEAVWAQVVSMCGDSSLGSAGQRCTSERRRGGQWDWFARYLDPILSDTDLVSEQAIARQIAQETGQLYIPSPAEVFSGAGDGDGVPLLAYGLIGALVLVGVMT